MLTKKDGAKTLANNFRALVDQVKQTETFDKEVARGEVSDLIDALMKKEEVTKAELARRLGKSRAYITKILQGNANFTLDTLVQIGRALGYKFAPLFVPQDLEWKPATKLRLSAKASGTAHKTTFDNEDYVPVPIEIDPKKDGDDGSTDPLVG